jgi:hypothetical protein
MLLNRNEKMNYAYLESGREIEANQLSNGVLRSNNYFCLFCGKDVSYVSGSKNKMKCRMSHFRHKKEESCINDSGGLSRSDLEKRAEYRVSNKRSTFHAWWQSLFDVKQIEVPFQPDRNHLNVTRRHVADVFLKSDNPIQLTLDNGQHLFKHSKNNLIIEIQHSNISVFDAQNRDTFYNTDDQNLLWIIDISHIEHKIERITTLTQDTFRILFPGKQHNGLINIICNCSRSEAVIDTGKYMFKIANTCLDIGFCNVLPMSKKGMLEQLCNQGFDVKIELCSEEHYDSQCVCDNERNYKQTITCLGLKHQVDVDEIFNMIEDIPITCLREQCENHAGDTFITYVDMIVSWLSIVSQKNRRVLSMLQVWAQNVKDVFYCKESLRFGKHRGVPLSNVPYSYLKWIVEKDIVNDPNLSNRISEIIAMNYYNLSQAFNNPKGLIHFSKCRDLYYRRYYDSRTLQQRENIFDSILQRDWIKLIEEVIPGEDGLAEHFTTMQDFFTNTVIDYSKKYRPVQYNNKYLAISRKELLTDYGKLDKLYSRNSVQL